MKTHVFSFFAAFGIFVFSAIHLSCVANAQEGVVLKEAAEVTAEVISIDKKNRIITLTGENVKSKEIKIPEEERNFDRIDVGDVVKIFCYESVVLSLGEPGSAPEANSGKTELRAKEGEKPEWIFVENTNVSAKVLAIDKENRTATLEKTDGTSVTVKVDPSVEGFDSVKVGDTVYALVTQTIAISVEEQNQ